MTSPDGVRMLSVVYAIALIICYPYKEPTKAEWPYSTLTAWLINAQNENTEVRSPESEVSIFRFTDGLVLWDIGGLAARRDL